MALVWMWALLSVFVVSLISLVGAIFLSMDDRRLKQMLIYMVSFSVGAFFGDVFIHLLPEIVRDYGFGIEISLAILAGIVINFAIEKFVRWQHCHIPTNEEHPHPFAIMNLVGDGVHNFIDGIVIGVSYLASVPIGLATTLAVILHEIPQEIGDFGVLLHGGFTKGKALFFNFLSAIVALVGTILALLLGTSISGVNVFLLPFAAGSFLYIAGSDLLPELHNHASTKQSIWQLVFFIAGIGVMALLLLVG